ncbi:HTH-type transcriptional repressor NicS [bacterium HR40]|nr:HTH-type transcriptional repressor NicS [bacterium HR40]
MIPIEARSEPDGRAVLYGESLGARRDPERSRRAILEAAVREFASHGIGGARVSRIARAAGVNKRMLYHYFGNKEALYLAALESVYERIRARELALEVDRLGPREAMRALVATVWSHFVEHPEFVSLLNSENLYRARHLRQSARIRGLQSPLVAMLERLLARGVAAGQFRDGVDPVQLYLSIAGLCYFYVSNRFTLSAAFGRDLMEPRALEERLAHVTEMVMAYLERRQPCAAAAPRPAPSPLA